MTVILAFIKHGKKYLHFFLVILGPNSILQWPNYGKGFFLSSLERNKTILGKLQVLVALPSQELKLSDELGCKMWLQTCAVKHFETFSYLCKAVFSPVQAWPEKSQHQLAGERHILKQDNRTVVNPAIQSPLNAPEWCSVCAVKRSSLVCTLGRWYLMKLHLCFLMLFISKDIAFWYNLCFISGTYSLPQASCENEAFMISLEN